MPSIIKYKSSPKATTAQYHIILEDVPHPQSMASAILLREYLKAQDIDYINSIDSLSAWLEFREKYLVKTFMATGDLVCAYCGRPHLEIGGRNPEDLHKNNRNPNLATIDHITALSNGGNKYDENNLCVSCKKCNNKKNNKDVEAFKAKIQNKKKLSIFETFSI